MPRVIKVIIPAYNEADSIEKVVGDIPTTFPVRTGTGRQSTPQVCVGTGRDLSVHEGGESEASRIEKAGGSLPQSCVGTEGGSLPQSCVGTDGGSLSQSCVGTGRDLSVHEGGESEASKIENAGGSLPQSCVGTGRDLSVRERGGILVSEIIVVSNGSTDATEENARKAGATVLLEPRKGYGYACLRGMQYLGEKERQPDIVVFLDGDYSDYPEELGKLVAPIIEDNIDMVIGARVKELREKGSMTGPQIFGNWLATSLMRLLFGGRFSDLGPFRAIKYSKLLQLGMEDKTYGWTIEMQLKALKQDLSYVEVPVHYRNRIGTSKVSGTFKGAFMAGVKILGWIFKYSFK